MNTNSSNLSLTAKTVIFVTADGQEVKVPIEDCPNPDLETANTNLAAANEEISTMHQLNDKLTNDAVDLNNQILELKAQIVTLTPPPASEEGKIVTSEQPTSEQTP
jgi:hypothetical protein